MMKSGSDVAQSAQTIESNVPFRFSFASLALNAAIYILGFICMAAFD